MGTFYSNCQVRSDSQETVVSALRGLLQEPAYVAPAVGGWVGIYPEGGSTDPDKLAKQLSANLACAVFSWNVHDSDVFYYTLYESGEPRDEFNSDPDWGADPDNEFSQPPDAAERARVRGDVEALLPFCLHGVTRDQIQQVLQPELVADDRYLFAEVQAVDLAGLLGMDEELASRSYRYIEAGEVNEHTREEFLEVSGVEGL